MNKKQVKFEFLNDEELALLTEVVGGVGAHFVDRQPLPNYYRSSVTAPPEVIERILAEPRLAERIKGKRSVADIVWQYHRDQE